MNNSLTTHTDQNCTDDASRLIIVDGLTKDFLRDRGVDFWIEDVTPFCKSIAGQICLLQFLPFVNQHTMTVTTEVRNNLVFILS